MNNLSYLEKLLDGAEVEWKALGEVSEILNGFAFEGSKYSDKGIRVIRISDVQKGKMSDKDLKFYPLDTVEKIERYLLQESDLVMSLTGNVGRVAMLSKTDLPAALNQRVACLRSKEGIVLTRYLFHFFDQISFENEAMSNATGGGQKNMSTRWLSSYQIPIPCPENPKKSLAIQAEIVRILDAFTSLTAELTAELTARKKQYNYYRDRLLTFSEGEVEWKSLEEICSSISAGGDLPENHVKGQIKASDEFPYPIYANATGDKGLYGFTDGYKIESDAVTISARGAKIGYHTIREGKFTPIIRLISLVPNKSVILTRYLNYILDRTPIGGTDGGIPQLTVPTVKKISIPVPSLAEQASIVSILDKFDALTNSISEGLPREIELRQKQYEYYRDQLLNFPKPAEAAA